MPTAEPRAVRFPGYLRRHCTKLPQERQKVIEQPRESLERLGFRFGINGPHAARTMMLGELRQLLAQGEPQAVQADYAAAIVGNNILGKPTLAARQLTLRHLRTLYALDGSNPIFRAMRRLWPSNEAAQPILALAVSLARDPLLRSTQEFLLAQPIGSTVTRRTLERVLALARPDRFSPASLKSFAQNVGGTWTAAGFLTGHQSKVRSQPEASPESLALLLFLSYLGGSTGQRLFSSSWPALLGRRPDELEALAVVAARRGLLEFMSAGGIKEVRFPGYLTPDEERIRQEVAHAV